MPATKSYAAQTDSSPLAPWTVERRDPKPHDVQIEILYCGVCHSDLHFARNEWGMTVFPVVPGHEIVGKVSAVGSHVKKFKVGTVKIVKKAWNSIVQKVVCSPTAGWKEMEADPLTADTAK